MICQLQFCQQYRPEETRNLKSHHVAAATPVQIMRPFDTAHACGSLLSLEAAILLVSTKNHEHFLYFLFIDEQCPVTIPMMFNSLLKDYHCYLKCYYAKKIHFPFFLQILKACLHSWASNFSQRLFSLSASLGFHGPQLFTFKTDWLELRGLERG